MYTIRKNSSGEDVRFDIDDESNGIKSFTYLAVAFYNSLKEGHIIVVDEIESSFHNYVLNYLLKMFYDDKEWNIKGAQLIFTTHNDMIFKYLNLNSIVIVNKTENNQTSINYLIDYADVKNDMDRWELIKNYFDGYYDGVPDIK
jgi:AAA15 family ATPase/GTPase